MSHTPGPWTVRPSSTSPETPWIVMAQDEAGFFDVAYPVLIQEGSPPSETLANADLIAAAPDMLKALKGLPIEYASGPCWDAARAAIAKAEGKQP